MVKQQLLRDKPYIFELEKTSYQPIFIMGLHRSGTTLLYELLGKTGLFNIVTFYHAVHYEELLSGYFEGTAQRTRQELNDWCAQRMETRLIDNVKFNADMPEEYAMILHAQTRSVFLDKKTFPIFDQLCRKIQFVSNPVLPLLLKSPFDFSSFLQIKEMLPAAKFVFILRDPIQILNSQLKALHTNLTVNNPAVNRLFRPYSFLHRIRPLVAVMRWATDPRSNGKLVRRFMMAKMKKQMYYYFNHIQQLPKTEYVVLHYENLCAKPAETINPIFALVGVQACISNDFATHICPRPFKLLPALSRDEEEIRTEFKKIMSIK
ncbi:MAG: sulfotransferase [Deltaproteobacteria bacterium]|nr:sulfotransferase [Deltaproteobacteria bacterium]